MLPVTLTPADGEALDGFLERLACVNGLDRAGLRAAIDVNLTFSPLTITAEAQRAIADEAGLSSKQVLRMTFAGYPGRPLTVSGLDPLDSTTLRRVFGQGWFPGKGSQFCPKCLDMSGRWLLKWRLPHVTACLEHDVYLVPRCMGCGLPSRHTGSTPFKGFMEQPTLCGNPTGAGTQCKTDLSVIEPWPITEPDREMAKTIADALDGQAQVILGRFYSAEEYLEELRSVSALLAHLALQTSSTNHRDKPWVGHLRAEQTPESAAVHRWCLTPPSEPSVRTGVMTSAQEILSAPELETAGQILESWLEGVPFGTDSPQAWLRDRSFLTRVCSELIKTATSPRWTISKHLRTYTRISHPLVPSLIPQVLPREPYVEHLGDLLGCGEGVGRLYASLCLARLTPGVVTWGGRRSSTQPPGGHGIKSSPVGTRTNVEPTAGTRERIVPDRRRPRPIDRLEGSGS